MLGLEVPHKKLEGISFLPLVETPGLAWKKAAFTLCRQGKHLGKSVRTKSHRYTEWIDYADRDDSHAIVRFTELYHLDVDELEQVNLANRIEYAPKRRELAELLSEGWESALPIVD
jgi:arylsulfatase A-like enzyme